MAVFFLCLGWAVPVRAEIYHFIDADGVRHFTNVPTDSRFQRLMIQDPDAVKAQSRRAQTLSILETIHRAAQRYSLEPPLIQAMVRVESNFDPLAVSSAGAMGLMQLMPQTARNWSVQNPFDPVENIWGGVRYFRYLMDLFENDPVLALAGYHAGERRVRAAGGVPAIPATQKYVKKVLKFYRSYRQKEPADAAVYRRVMPGGTLAFSDQPDPYGRLDGLLP